MADAETADRLELAVIGEAIARVRGIPVYPTTPKGEQE